MADWPMSPGVAISSESPSAPTVGRSGQRAHKAAGQAVRPWPRRARSRDASGAASRSGSLQEQRGLLGSRSARNGELR
jgi:hypothetical protein